MGDSARLLVSSGQLEGGIHRMPIRVYYEDTDAAGIVFYANYLRYTERARTDMLRLIGITQSALAQQQGIAFAVRRCAIDYRAPARLDDALEVRSRLTHVGGASIAAEQSIFRGGERLIDSTLAIACIGRDGRPRRLPPPIRTALAACVSAAGHLEQGNPA